MVYVLGIFSKLLVFPLKEGSFTHVYISYFNTLSSFVIHCNLCMACMPGALVVTIIYAYRIQESVFGSSISQKQVLKNVVGGGFLGFAQNLGHAPPLSWHVSCNYPEPCKIYDRLSSKVDGT